MLKPLIYWPLAEFEARAKALSAHWGWPLLSDNDLDNAQALWRLHVSAEVSLERCNDGLRYAVDLVGGRAGWRKQHGGGVNEPLARACGLKQGKRPTILDATPGWLRDAWVLAALGCDITACERVPLVYVLAQDGLRRALADPVNHDIAARIHLMQCDSSDYLRDEKTADIDVIYLDPMFPPREKTAAVKKDMQVLQALAETDLGEELLPLALNKARQRVVVKRPDYAPDLAGLVPQASVPAGAHRFDIYLR